MRVNTPDNNINKIKNAIIQNFPELIDDGEVESGTYEWNELLAIALTVNGLNMNSDELRLAMDGEAPYAQRLDDFIEKNKLKYISDLAKALERLNIEIV